MNKQELKERYFELINLSRQSNKDFIGWDYQGFFNEAVKEFENFEVNLEVYELQEKKSKIKFYHQSTQQIYEFIKLVDDNSKAIPETILMQIMNDMMAVVNKYKEAIESI